MAPVSQHRLLVWPRGPLPWAPLPGQLEQGKGLLDPSTGDPPHHCRLAPGPRRCPQRNG